MYARAPMRLPSIVSRALLVLALPLAVAACNEGRFPTCKDNAECAKNTDGGAPVCYDLRCVECAYDVDCAPGKVCNGASKTCDSLGGATAATGEGDAGAEKSKWEPGSWDDCARDCKDQDCVHSCDGRFPKPAASAKSKKPGKSSGGK
jgi:hypothetical protein